MTNAELIKALRYCGQERDVIVCENCVRRVIENGVDSDCEGRLMRDSADALETAEKRIARLEEDLKTREAEREVMQDTIKICEEAADRYKAQLPKEGEWKWLSSTYDRVPCEMRYWCSVCHHEEITHNYKPWKRYCPNCGAKMRGEHDEQ